MSLTRTLILEAASGPTGTGTRIPGLTSSKVCAAIWHLVRSGEIVVAGKRPLRRLFTCPKAAAAYELSLPAVAEAHRLEIMARQAQRDAQKSERRAKERAAKKARAVSKRASRASRKRPPKPPPKPPKPAVLAKPRKTSVTISKSYGRAPWTADTPAIVPQHVQVQHCPSPAHFGLMAKIWGVGA